MKELSEVFRECWDEQIADSEQRAPSIDREDYVATGRAPAAYGGKRNEEWWLDNGPDMVQSYIDWRRDTRWALWETPSGLPGVELELNFALPSGVPIKAFIDRVFVSPAGVPVILDIKTGRQPETAEQLGLYALGLEAVYGVRPTWGYFWTPAKGHVGPFDLDRYTAPYFDTLYGDVIRGINAGAFPPKPANNCKNWCGVARYCAAVGGADAEGVDRLAGRLLTYDTNQPKETV